MTPKLFLFFILLLVSSYTLQLQRNWQIIAPDAFGDRFDPSGLVLFQERLLTVSDKDPGHIYQLVPDEEGTVEAQNFITVDADSLQQYRQLVELPLDIEGITCYGETLYLVDEKNRHVLAVSPEGTLRPLPIDFAKYNRRVCWNPFSGVDNAGFEGIACDTQTKQLYVMNERMYRHVYVVQLENHEITGHFDVPAGDNAPRYLGDLAIYPDYAGGDFSDGYLYLLYRNDYKILKVDPVKKAIVAEAVYGHATRDLYQTTEPFGLAEGIVIDKQRILIVLDNNGIPQRQKPSSKRAMLLEFIRPKGF